MPKLFRCVGFVVAESESDAAGKFKRHASLDDIFTQPATHDSVAAESMLDLLPAYDMVDEDRTCREILIATGVVS